MSKMVNAALIDGLGRELDGNDSCLVVGSRGMTVKDMEQFRGALREKDYSVRWVKNALARVALARTEMKEVGRVFDGSSALILGEGGAIGSAKILVEEVKKYKDKLVVHGGYFEGEVLDAEGVNQLSKAPSREEALAMVLSGLFGPVSDLHQSMGGLLSEVHGLIEALEKEKGGA